MREPGQHRGPSRPHLPAFLIAGLVLAAVTSLIVGASFLTAPPPGQSATDFVAQPPAASAAAPPSLPLDSARVMAARAAFAHTQAVIRRQRARARAAVVQAPPAPAPAPAPSMGGNLSGTLGCSGLEALWESAGGSASAAVTAADVAIAESGGNQFAVSPTDDIGYWQINAPSWGSMASTDPLTNARAAVQISGDGGNWSGWTVYTSGAYTGSGC